MSTSTVNASPAAVQIIRAEVRTDGSLRFNVPNSSQDIRSVDAVDLDLVFTTFSGEKIILQQGALHAAMKPQSPIVFGDGISITAAEQSKKIGVLKPVEGGSFRLHSADTASTNPEKISGDEFGLGKDLQDAMNKLTQTSQQLEKVLQNLTTASLTSPADPVRTPGIGPGVTLAKFKTQAPDQFASPSPGAPPSSTEEQGTTPLLTVVQTLPSPST